MGCELPDKVKGRMVWPVWEMSEVGEEEDEEEEEEEREKRRSIPPDSVHG